VIRTLVLSHSSSSFQRASCGKGVSIEGLFTSETAISFGAPKCGGAFGKINLPNVEGQSAPFNARGCSMVRDARARLQACVMKPDPLDRDGSPLVRAMLVSLKTSAPAPEWRNPQLIITEPAHAPESGRALPSYSLTMCEVSGHGQAPMGRNQSQPRRRPVPTWWTTCLEAAVVPQIMRGR